MEPQPRAPQPPAPTSPAPTSPAPTSARQAAAGAHPTAAARSPLSIPSFAPVAELDLQGYERLTREVRTLLGIDLAQYKPAQMWRRVNGFANARGLPDVFALVARSRTDATLRQAFLDMLTINVSEFFRNAESFVAFGTTFLAPMVRRQTTTRIWSAGCSLGYEPYSLAILAREAVPGANLRIVGTDLDETTLAKARASRYTENQMLGVSPARRARWFRQDGDCWEVKPELRALVTFKRHDLLRDPYESGLDAIVCRNVVIYFTESAKSEMYRRFAAALRPGGVLFVGATESIGNSRALGLEPAGNSFYVRPD